MEMGRRVRQSINEQHYPKPNICHTINNEGVAAITPVQQAIEPGKKSARIPTVWNNAHEHDRRVSPIGGHLVSNGQFLHCEGVFAQGRV